MSSSTYQINWNAVGANIETDTTSPEVNTTNTEVQIPIIQPPMVEIQDSSPMTPLETLIAHEEVLAKLAQMLLDMNASPANLDEQDRNEVKQRFIDSCCQLISLGEEVIVNFSPGGSESSTVFKPRELSEVVDYIAVVKSLGLLPFRAADLFEVLYTLETGSYYDDFYGYSDRDLYLDYEDDSDSGDKSDPDNWSWSNSASSDGPTSDSDDESELKSKIARAFGKPDYPVRWPPLGKGGHFCPLCYDQAFQDANPGVIGEDGDAEQDKEDVSKGPYRELANSNCPWCFDTIHLMQDIWVHDICGTRWHNHCYNTWIAADETVYYPRCGVNPKDHNDYLTNQIGTTAANHIGASNYRCGICSQLIGRFFPLVQHRICGEILHARCVRDCQAQNNHNKGKCARCVGCLLEEDSLRDLPRVLKQPGSGRRWLHIWQE